MNTVLWIFVAIAGGLLLFTSIQNDLPAELSFLKSDGVDASAPAAQGSIPQGLSQYQGWNIRNANGAIELTRALQANIVVNGVVYENPEFGFLCNKGKVDMRLDTKAQTTGRKATSIALNGEAPQQWEKSASFNIFPKKPGNLLELLRIGQPVEFKISYAELGVQAAWLHTAAMPSLLQAMPVACR